MTLKAQSALILPDPILLASLPALLQEISGFFIVETHVLETTGNFRSQRDVEELWDSLASGLAVSLTNALRVETDPDGFLRVKELLLAFMMTLEVPRSYCLMLSSTSIDPISRRHLPIRRKLFILS